MAKFPFVDALDELDEKVKDPKEFYVKGADGKFYPDLDVEALPTVQGLVSTLRKFKEVAPDASKLSEKLKRLEELEAVDPEEYKRLKEEAESRKGKETSVELLQKEHKRQLEEVQAASQKREKAAEEVAEKERAAARRYFRDSELTAAVTSAKGRPHMLNRELEQHVEIQRDDTSGEFRMIVLGPGGGPRVKDSAGNHCTVDDLVQEYKDNPDWGGAFEASGGGGSGANPAGSGGGTGGKTFDRGDPLAWGRNADKIATGDVTAA